MAKRRKRRTITRRTFAAKRRPKRRSSKDKIELLQPVAMGYGAARSFIAQIVQPTAQRLLGPLVGGAADEIGMAAVNFFVAQNSSGVIKKAARIGLVAENVLFGADIGTNIMPQLNALKTNNNNVPTGTFLR
jgi:hypothetical protein